MIEVENITKSFGTTKALQDISFSVQRGQLFGLIGPDGAGKTTLFRILVTLLLPDSGKAKVADFDLGQYRNIRHVVGYMPGRFSLYQDLTVAENLSFFATIFGTTVKENYDLVKDIYVQLEPFKNRRAGKLSGGMKQKLALCCALIHRPQVLFLDEPTTGVDAVSRKEFWEMLRRLKQHKLTILVSTPYMDEADLCDKIALIQNGQLLAVDTPKSITSQFSKKLFAVRSANTYQLIKDLRQAPFTDSCYAFGEYLHLTLKEDLTSSAQIGSYLQHRAHQDIEIKPIQAGIEDSFIALVNQQATPIH